MAFNQTFFVLLVNDGEMCSQRKSLLRLQQADRAINKPVKFFLFIFSIESLRARKCCMNEWVAGAAIMRASKEKIQKHINSPVGSEKRGKEEVKVLLILNGIPFHLAPPQMSGVRPRSGTVSFVFNHACQFESKCKFLISQLNSSSGNWDRT